MLWPGHRGHSGLPRSRYGRSLPESRVRFDETKGSDHRTTAPVRLGTRRVPRRPWPRPAPQLDTHSAELRRPTSPGENKTWSRVPEQIENPKSRNRRNVASATPIRRRLRFESQLAHGFAPPVHQSSDALRMLKDPRPRRRRTFAGRQTLTRVVTSNPIKMCATAFAKRLGGAWISPSDP